MNIISNFNSSVRKKCKRLKFIKLRKMKKKSRKQETGKHDPPVRDVDYEPVPSRRSIQVEQSQEIQESICPEVVHRATNFEKISNICQLKRLYRPAITIYLSTYALCYQFSAFIESFNTSEMSVVSTSIDCLSETTKAKENTQNYLDR